MSSKAIIGIIVAIVVVGGGAWYFSSSPKSGEEGAMMKSGEEASMAEGSGVFADLLMRAGSWKCDVKTTYEEAPSEGTVYVADGKVRADFTSEMDGSTVTSHMINADGYVYTWSDSYPQGMKMKIPEGETAAETSTEGGVDYNSQVEYSCGAWGTDMSMFTPPASVTFMELGESMMPGMMPGAMPEGYPMPN